MRFSITAFLLAAFSTVAVYSQLSPGDLTEAHAHLEGLLNCTECHDLGKGVSDQKCLACHTLLQERITQNRGFHVSSLVKSKSCVECHSDHHGRQFDIVHLDSASFDHALTGYKLEGSHLDQPCGSCHQDQFIASSKIKKKAFTFLGLSNDCLSCHEDVHEGTLSQDCASCHDFEDFKPASKFDHSQANFSLQGAHLDVDCIECHPKSEGQPLLTYTGIAHDNCSSCHDDVHNGRMGDDCRECHSEESFKVIKGMVDFDHSSTRFTLNGQHRFINCSSCHDDGTSNAPFREFESWKSFRCSSCHEDVHDTKFGSDCSSCHLEKSFRSLLPSAPFDHGKTDYALEGAHINISCNECHGKGSKIKTLRHDQCTSCHEDFHNGQFDFSGGRDCDDCHTLDDFSVTTYTLKQHQETAFPLRGAHLASPCFECHKQEDQWVFKFADQNCVTCHEDVHNETLAELYYPDQNCTNCHNEDRWSVIQFDHTITDFALTGRHLDIRCIECHSPEESSSAPIKFDIGADLVCASCHQDVHMGQFEHNNQTDCTRCHSTEGWQESNFDHDKTAFKLDGAHRNLACSQCHLPQLVDSTTIIIYQIESFRCVDCHQ